jgi:hypothetical protein
MDTEEHCKEVYAYYGLAMYRAQCVEQSISQLIVFFDFFKRHVPSYSSAENWENDIDRFDELLSAKTMGQLNKHLISLEVIDAEIASLLKTALLKRNRLAHRFFVDFAIDFVSSPGRDKMIGELEADIELFNTVEEILNPITYKLCEKYGLTEERLDEIKAQLLDEADSDLDSNHSN